MSAERVYELWHGLDGERESAGVFGTPEKAMASLSDVDEWRVTEPGTWKAFKANGKPFQRGGRYTYSFVEPEVYEVTVY